jgi:pyruvate/2-oxoglutarate dehydrogenase complex dihydrolipoamide dehydrogenase (E3) component
MLQTNLRDPVSAGDVFSRQDDVSKTLRRVPSPPAPRQTLYTRPSAPDPLRETLCVRPSACTHGAERSEKTTLTDRTDVVVLGLGPGGEELAGRLAQAGLEVIGVDGGLVGGECPYWGCVPSKMMIRAADLLAEARRVDGMAGSATVTPDWAPVATRIRDEATDGWDDIVAVERLEHKGARFVRGWGRLDGPRRVVVGDLEIEARKGIVINTGSKPWSPPIPGLDTVPYWTNREAIETTSVPSSLVVIGGGSICVELAQVFARFGAAVTIIDAANRLVALEEPEASDLLARVFEREGIRVVCGVKARSVSHEHGRFTLEIDHRSGSVTAEELLLAAGRWSDLSPIGVGSVGIDESAKAIPVDGRMRAAEGVWAIGDVTGKGAFTHMSMYQAAICGDDILGEPVTEADYKAVPRVTFTDPEIGSVGLTEALARDSGLEVRVGITEVPTSTRGWIHKAGNDGFIKLVEDSRRGVLVGATSAGPWGGEVLGLLSLAVHAEVPTEKLRHMIYAYPTFHRAIETALSDLRH